MHSPSGVLLGGGLRGTLPNPTVFLEDAGLVIARQVFGGRAGSASLAGTYPTDQDVLGTAMYLPRLAGIPAASAGMAGTMSAADKAKLDGIPSGLIGPTSQPSGAQTPAAYSQIVEQDDPLVVASGDVIALTATGALLWLDSTAPRSIQLAQSIIQPTTDQTLLIGAVSKIEDDALVIDSPRLLVIPPTSILWTDAARCPQTISTLLIIAP